MGHQSGPNVPEKLNHSKSEGENRHTIATDKLQNYDNAQNSVPNIGTIPSTEFSVSHMIVTDKLQNCETRLGPNRAWGQMLPRAKRRLGPKRTQGQNVA